MGPSISMLTLKSYFYAQSRGIIHVSKTKSGLLGQLMDK